MSDDTRTNNRGVLNLLKVGVAVHEGHAPDRAAWSEITRKVVRSALGQQTNREFPARLIVLLATPEWCQPDYSLSLLIREALRSTLGYDVPLIGGSMPRIFASMPLLGGTKEYRIAHGFVLIVLCSDDLWASVSCVPEPYNLTDGERSNQLKAMAGRIRQSKNSHLALGTSASAELFAMLPGPYLDLNGNRCFRDIELYQEVMAAFDDTYVLFGGSAANDLERSLKGFQFADNDCLTSSLAVALLEHDFRIGGAMGHGFKPIPDLMVSVDELGSPDSTSDYVVSKLNGKPASECLLELMEIAKSPSLRPVLGLGVSETCHIAVPVDESRYWVKSVRFNRKLTRGYRLSVLNSTHDELREGAKKFIALALKRTGAPPSELRLIFAMACLGRFIKYERENPESWWDAVRDLTRQYSETAPVVCGVVAGEYAEDHRLRPRGDNLSLWITCMAGIPNARARNRLLQVGLLAAGHTVLAQSNPIDVMGSAIRSAVQIGAEGGQICVCDPEHQLILGGELGFAFSNPSSDQNFKVVLKMTTRRLPEPGTHFKLPEALRQSCLQVGPLPIGSRMVDLPSGTDVLAIATANRVCIDVSDSSKPMFYCDQQAAQAGNLQAQIIMPLIGSKNTVLGTIQLGFPYNRAADRETLGLWVGFGQMISAALERSFEAEEREIIQRIYDLGNTIAQRPPGASHSIEGGIEEFLNIVREQLRLDYVHVRMRQRTHPEKRRYQLIVPASTFGMDHKRERPTISEGEGSMRNALERGPIFPLTKQEMDKVYPPHDKVVGMHLSNVERVLENFQTVANVLLGSKDDPLGCLVLHCRSEYFFTTRRRRLILQIVPILENLITNREANFIEHRRQKVERDLVNQGFWAAKTIHDLMRPLTNIKGLAELSMRTTLPENKNLKEIRQITEVMTTLLKERARGVEMGTRVVTVATLLSEAIKGMAYSDSRPPVPNFGDSVGDCKVQSNVWLRAALTNLMENAEEASRDGKGQTLAAPISIEVTNNPQFEFEIWITIENDGPNLTQDKVDQLREPGTSMKKGHLGLGITLAEAGVFSVNGNLILRPRLTGGLQVIVQLREARETIN